MPFPSDLIPDYVSALTHTYVGYIGGSQHFQRSDFYANSAAVTIPQMVEKFDDAASVAFVECVRTSDKLKRRIENPRKLNRLRSLGNIVLSRISDSFPERDFIEAMLDDAKAEIFFRALRG